MLICVYNFVCPVSQTGCITVILPCLYFVCMSLEGMLAKHWLMTSLIWLLAAVIAFITLSTLHDIATRCASQQALQLCRVWALFFTWLQQTFWGASLGNLNIIGNIKIIFFIFIYRNPTRVLQARHVVPS